MSIPGGSFTKSSVGDSTPTFAPDNGGSVLPRRVHALGPIRCCRPCPRLGHAELGRGLYLAVSDIEAARDELAATRGVDTRATFSPRGRRVRRFQPDGRGRVEDYRPITPPMTLSPRLSGHDQLGWLLQEVTARLPGRIDTGETTFASVADLASALRRAGRPRCSQRIGAADVELARLVRRIRGLQSKPEQICRSERR